MANLIPPDAKRAMITEYWFRVVTVWFIIIGFAFITISLLKLPTFVLVQSQLNAFSNAYDHARSKEEAFSEAQEMIRDANELSVMLASTATSTQLTEVIAMLDSIAGNEVAISNFQFSKTDTAIESIKISGIADTRSGLADFSKNIEAHPLFAEAALPLSNLAKDKDIVFNIEIIPTPK